MCPSPDRSETLDVVLVDDDDVDRLAIRRLLEQSGGYAVREFSSGEDALAALAETPCDCLLLDYRMPGVDGFAVLEQLSERGLEIPTLVLTGAGDEEVAVGSLQRGALDYLTKSRLDRLTLLAKIRGVRMVHEARRQTRTAERDLHELIDQLQRAVHARESVLGVVSHDLRGPLNNIHLAISLIETGGDEQRLAALGSIRRAVVRADRLISDLLDVARMSDDDGMPIARSQTEIAGLIATAIDDVQPAVSSKQVEIEVEIPDDCGEIFADRDRVIQVLDNLLRNAIKYGPHGGKLRIVVEPRADEVEFAIADEGPGLEPEARTQVFDRFWQAKDKNPTSGSGIGLAIAKGIVESHGGRIDVGPSELGGARFYFTIPRVATN